MIESLISALGLELDLTSREIADVVWLALQMQKSDRLTDAESAESIATAPQAQELPRSPKTTDRQTPQEEPAAGLYNPDPGYASGGMAGALSLRVPDARSLREPLSLARALKPLLRLVAASQSTTIDEAATVERIIEQQVWLPVLKPSLEPALELALVVDESVSMQIWQRTIADLQRFLTHYGAFRDVRVWGLLSDGQGRVRVRPGIGKAGQRQSLRLPSELLDPSGQRLILVATDCVGDLWRDGKLQPVMKLWAASGPMAIVQMLPEWLWSRTRLGFAASVRLRAALPGMPNQQLEVRDLSPWDEIDLVAGVKVPVVTLEPEPFGAWAQMMMGKGSAWSAGVVLEPEVLGQSENDFVQNDELTAEERVQQFRVTASPLARRLAGLLAAAPVISLPVVRIIQQRLLPESRQVHVAEVFLGGLLKPLVEITAETNADAVQYEFLDGVREILLEALRTSESVNVLNEVSQFVAERLGLTIDQFTAVLRNPQQAENQELVGNARPFAFVTAHILRQLGNEYIPFADELEQLLQVFQIQELKNLDVIFPMLLRDLQQATSASEKTCRTVANRLAQEVTRICRESNRIQDSGDVLGWATTLARHRLQQCLHYYNLGARQGRMHLHSSLSQLVYKCISPVKNKDNYQVRLTLIEDFLQSFYIESLNTFRQENQVANAYLPTKMLELAEYMAFTERYAKRRIPLPGRRNQQLIILRAQTFSQQQPVETLVDIERAAEGGMTDGEDSYNAASVQQLRELMVSQDQEPAEDGLRESVVQELIAYLEERKQQDCIDYFVLRLQDLPANEIEAILGLTARQRDYLQQRFKYHLVRFTLSSQRGELVHRFWELT
jgi:hypothetical protein